MGPEYEEYGMVCAEGGWIGDATTISLMLVYAPLHRPSNDSLSRV